MDSPVHTHVNTCGFKREHVIRSDNVWLSEVMFGKRCGTRVRGHPTVDFRIPNAISYGHWRAVLPHGSPRAYIRFSQENTQEFRKNYTRIATEYHKNPTRFSQEFHKPKPQNPAEITSVFHAKTLEYVCHTGRTYEPPENSCPTLVLH